VLRCEKVALTPFVERLAQRFGVSWLVSRGMTKLQDAERFAGELPPSPVKIVAYVGASGGSSVRAENLRWNKASPTIPSWNQLVEWLRELDLLRRSEAA
jgi:hypothetical protein